MSIRKCEPKEWKTEEEKRAAWRKELEDLFEFRERKTYPVEIEKVSEEWWESGLENK